MAGAGRYIEAPRNQLVELSISHNQLAGISKFSRGTRNERGTWLIKEELFKQEMARWFSSYETLTGRIASTHLVTPKWAFVGRATGARAAAGK